MPAADFAGWNRYLARHDGDVRTHFLIAQLTHAVIGMMSKNPPSVFKLAPWLEPHSARLEREQATRRARFDFIESVYLTTEGAT